MKVGVIDYGVGNLGSVLRAVEIVGAKPILIENPRNLSGVDSLILPGVGNFTECKSRLDKYGWTVALENEVLSKMKPLLGICVGMQLLADFGVEGASADCPTCGLGFIRGTVRSLKELGCNLRLPHMGWNSVVIENSQYVLSSIPDRTDFYFVHSYALEPEESESILATTEYDIRITAVVRKDNVWGTQFHPEKSSRAGFRILRNFVQYQDA